MVENKTSTNIESVGINLALIGAIELSGASIIFNNINKLAGEMLAIHSIIAGILGIVLYFAGKGIAKRGNQSIAK